MVIINDNPSDFIEKMQKCQEQIGALEEECEKIKVFERELPLCLQLVTQAIQRCRKQVCGTTRDYFSGQSDQFPEKTFEEFIPIKRNSSANEDDHVLHKQKQQQQLCNKHKITRSQDKSSLFSTKSDWLSSAQLSIQTPGQLIKEDLSLKKESAIEINKNGGSKSEDKRRSKRKARRCWSSELHRRFLHALQQLGGAHVATPKQIKEFMKVDGLTSDEVKSHLQKYRLHTRKLNLTTHSNHTQTPHYVVVGGLWMPPPKYAIMVASTPSSRETNDTKGVYTSIASLSPSITTHLYKTEQRKPQSYSHAKGSHLSIDSPSTSSTHTTTASLAFGFS